ncbi:MAG: CocE/NonD family hydrolase [Bryobacteraceae bacterium]
MGTHPNERSLKTGIDFWNEMMKHGTYDEFWQARNLRPHLTNIKPAVMAVGGWFDAEDLFGALNVYKSIEQSTPGANNTLIMAPWFHGGWARGDGELLGNVHFGAKTSAFTRKNRAAVLLVLAQGSTDPKVAEAYVFETGTNQWRRMKGMVSEERYQAIAVLPFKWHAFVRSAKWWERRRLRRVRQQSVQTRAVHSGSSSGNAGPIWPNLQVSTTGTDSDWVVKLIDVYSDDYPNPNPNPTGIQMAGYHQLIRDEVMRGKFRDSYEHPAPFVPGRVTKVAYAMPDIFHTFRKGHRIMVQVQSSWFPLVDRNPQKFMDIYNAKMTDFQKATQRVYHSRTAASFVAVDVL